MEIEKKFLLYERGKNFSNKKYFPMIKLIKLETKLLGKKIIQSYINLKHLEKVIKISGIKLNFKPNEIRVRKYGRSYFLTLKFNRKGYQREELEVKIPHNIYSKLYKLKEIELQKTRYAKKMNGMIIEFDYYKKLNLLTCDVEVESEEELQKIPNFGKLVSGIKKYRNSELAKHFS